MFNGNQKLIIEKAFDYDEYGQKIFSQKLASFGTIVRANTIREQSPLIGELSQTSGNAYENTTGTTILAQIKPNIEIGDKLTVVGIALRVNSKEVRYDIEGRAHHLQLGCSIWAM